MAYFSSSIYPSVNGYSDVVASAPPPDVIEAEEVSHQKYPVLYDVADWMVNGYPKQTLIAAIVIILAIGGVIGGLAGVGMPLSVTISVGSSLLTVYAIIGIALLIFRCQSKREAEKSTQRRTEEQNIQQDMENREIELQHENFVHGHAGIIQQSVGLTMAKIFKDKQSHYVEVTNNFDMRQKVRQYDGTYAPSVLSASDLSHPVTVINHSISFTDQHRQQHTLIVPLIYFRICPRDEGVFKGCAKTIAQIVFYPTFWVPHSRSDLAYECTWKATPATFKRRDGKSFTTYFSEDELGEIVDGSDSLFRIAS
jgi:hypothetical protein